MKDTDITKVIFRKYKSNGDILAVFPEHAGTNHPSTCSCYERVGQHGTMAVSFMAPYTVPATKRKYASLKRELEQIGYNLKVVKRSCPAYFNKRVAEIGRV